MADVSSLVAEVQACWKDVRREAEGLDLKTPVYPDPVWTMLDVLAHCAFWNDEAVAAIEAFRRGERHVTDTGADSFEAGIDDLNRRTIERSRERSDADIWQQWTASQDAFTEAVRALDNDALTQEMTCPWDERKPVEAMVRDELAHETEHIDDIVTAVSAQEG